jgi:hypothetical protein
MLCRPSRRGKKLKALETHQGQLLREGDLRRKAGPTNLHLGAKGAPLNSKKTTTKCRECNVYLHCGLEGEEPGCWELWHTHEDLSELRV